MCVTCGCDEVMPDPMSGRVCRVSVMRDHVYMCWIADEARRMTKKWEVSERAWECSSCACACAAAMCFAHAYTCACPQKAFHERFADPSKSVRSPASGLGLSPASGISAPQQRTQPQQQQQAQRQPAGAPAAHQARAGK